MENPWKSKPGKLGLIIYLLQYAAIIAGLLAAIRLANLAESMLIPFYYLHDRSFIL